MGWKMKSKMSYRKPILEGNGENAKGVKELAESYIRKGFTRQAAYARARKELGTTFKRKNKKMFQGGGVSSK